VPFCWNDLALSQKLVDLTDTTSREGLREALTHGSAVARQPLNRWGESDFSEERLPDTVGMRPPQTSRLNAGERGEHQTGPKSFEH
jgi:hypothetical protein